jgi:hypothetical protein
MRCMKHNDNQTNRQEHIEVPVWIGVYIVDEVRRVIQFAFVRKSAVDVGIPKYDLSEAQFSFVEWEYASLLSSGEEAESNTA